MATGTTRTAVVVGLLVVAAGIGYLVGTSGTVTATSTIQRVLVGPTCDKLSKDPVTLSIRAGDLVLWKSTNGQKLNITFHAKNFPLGSSVSGVKEPPFVGIAGQDLQVPCSGDSCSPYEINQRLLPLFNSNRNLTLTYKYDQAIDGVWCDGRIIIQW